MRASGFGCCVEGGGGRGKGRRGEGILGAFLRGFFDCDTHVEVVGFVRGWVK